MVKGLEGIWKSLVEPWTYDATILWLNEADTPVYLMWSYWGLDWLQKSDIDIFEGLILSTRWDDCRDGWIKFII